MLNTVDIFNRLLKWDRITASKRTEEVTEQEPERFIDEVLLPENPEQMWKYLAKHCYTQEKRNYELLAPMRENPYVARLLYQSLRRAEEFLKRGNYYGSPQYNQGWIRAEITDDWSSDQRPAKYSVEIRGFATYRNLIRDPMEIKLREDAKRMMATVSEEDRQQILDALEKIEIAVPLCVSG